MNNNINTKKKKQFSPTSMYNNSLSNIDMTTRPSVYGGGFVPTKPIKPVDKQLPYDDKTEGVSTNNAKVEEKNVVNKTNEALANYRNQLKLDTASAQGEIMSANKLANQYLQNYLKQQGILGTGVGQSQYTNLATNYANQMAQTKLDEATKYQTALKEYQEGRTEELGAVLSTMNENEREAYLNQIRQEEGLDQQYINSLEAMSKQYTAQEKQNKIDYVAKLIEDEVDPISIRNEINKLKQQGIDTSKLEAYYNAVGNTVKSEVIDVYRDIVNALNSSDFKGDRNAYETTKNILSVAINSNNEDNMAKAYNYAYNVIYGTPELNKNSDIQITTNQNQTITTAPQQSTQVQEETQNKIKENANVEDVVLSRGDTFVYEDVRGYLKPGTKVYTPKGLSFEVVSVDLENNKITYKDGKNGQTYTGSLSAKIDGIKSQRSDYGSVTISVPK